MANSPIITQFSDTVVLLVFMSVLRAVGGESPSDFCDGFNELQFINLVTHTFHPPDGLVFRRFEQVWLMEYTINPANQGNLLMSIDCTPL